MISFRCKLLWAQEPCIRWGQGPSTGRDTRRTYRDMPSPCQTSLYLFTQVSSDTRGQQRCGLLPNYFGHLLLTLLLIGCVAALARCGLLLSMSWSLVCLCVCVFLTVGLLVSTVSPAKMNLWRCCLHVDSGGPKEPCIRWVLILHGKGQFCGDMTGGRYTPTHQGQQQCSLFPNYFGHSCLLRYPATFAALMLTVLWSWSVACGIRYLKTSRFYIHSLLKTCQLYGQISTKRYWISCAVSM